MFECRVAAPWNRRPGPKGHVHYMSCYIALQDFLFQYKAGVEGVTADNVLAAAQCHLHPGQQTAVVVGNAKELGPALRAAGFEVVPLPLDPL